MDSVTDSGGRVTRALRKRITSVDSDSSSRPGTPVQSTKVTAAASKLSTDSPLKPRMTRRNSLSGTATPVKTPAKRAGAISSIAENDVEKASPARRTTRRRSMSAEIETPVKSVGVKAPNFDTLPEELENSRMTRSKSKSPQQTKLAAKPLETVSASKGKRKSLRNSPMLKEINGDIEVKEKNHKDANEEKENNSPKKDEPTNINNQTVTPSKDNRKSITLDKHNTPKIAEEKNNESSVVLETEVNDQEVDKSLRKNQTDEKDNDDNVPQNSDNTPMEVSSPLKPQQDAEKNDSLMLDEVNKPKAINSPIKQQKDVDIISQNETTTPKEVRKGQTPSKHDIDKDNNNVENPKIERESEATNESTCPIDKEQSVIVMEADDPQDIVIKLEMPEEKPEEDINELAIHTASKGLQNPEDLKSDTDNVMEMSVDPNETEEICKTPTKSTSFMTATTNESSNKAKTKVAFINAQFSDDECEKSIYPKTPGSAKTKSFIEIDSPLNGSRNDDSVLSVHTSDMEIPETQEVVERPQRKIMRKNIEKDIEEDDGDQSQLFEESRMEKKSEQSKDENSSGNQNDENEDNPNENMALEEKDKKEPNSPKVGKRKTLSPRKEIESPTKSPQKVEVSVVKTPSKDSSDIADENDNISLKWCNPRVKSDGSTKLDTIVDEQMETTKTILPNENPKAQVKKQKKKLLKRTEWKSDDESGEETEENEILSEGDEPEKPYERKHAFHDDEAMVVDDYESGDSMDSEERREMSENEIPIDGESIGSHTTDSENDGSDEEEGSENDSFIVSDNEDEENDANHLGTESDDENEEEDVEELKEIESKKREKKKTYKRIQRVNDASSSSDEEDVVLNKSKSSKEKEETTITGPEEKPATSLNNSKLSDSALRLQSEGDSDSQSDEANKTDANKSRQDILRKLNQSDRFNKSVRDLNPDVDASPEIAGEFEKQNGNSKEEDTQCDPEEEEQEEEEEEIVTNVSLRMKNYVSIQESNENEKEESDSDQKMENGFANESIMHNMRVTTEEEEEDLEECDNENVEDDGVSNEDSNSDNDKENADKMLSKFKHNKGLSVSFTHPKNKKRDSLQKRVLQRSFTIGVRINGGEVDTAVIEATTKGAEESSSTSENDQENEDVVLSSEELNILENIKHIPLGNPLVRTRRQSLVLPTNPDMEIGSSTKASKSKRKSLGLLSANEFNPSQSFVHSLELRKAEFDRQTTKRKRLSKSFSGTTEGHDASIIDLDAHHLHKRSKLVIDSSFVDSLENLSSNKNLCSNVKHSSTPREKVSKKHNNSISRILNRCDEILEAANRAKLEAKQNYKKSKVKLSKKSKKALQRQSLSPDSKQDKLFAPITKEFKKKDKIKRVAAVTRALKASADLIIGKPNYSENDEEQNDEDVENSRHLPANILEAIEEIEKSRPKKTKKAFLEHNKQCRNYTTSAGNVVETLRTPEKKKKKCEIIQLPTGKVCVEPITPTKRSIYTCNGMEFHESPATPCARGFDIQFSALDTPEFQYVCDRKRKRKDEIKKKTYPKPQWTQSGLFVEEELPRASHCSRILKKHNHQNYQQACGNFKQNAMFRGDIKRSSAREILQLRERRPLHSNY
ncbi:slender lobes [Haematobia irritans]|uniref:slender lobes n=1 Tax=Haematobia irritans TaxID=7368 RepID=UPI003F501EBE